MRYLAVLWAGMWSLQPQPLPQQDIPVEPRIRLEHRGRVVAISFSPDGKLVAAGGGPPGETILWEVATGRKRHSLLGKSDLIWSVSFSPDGKSLAAGGRDKLIHIWDVETGQETRTLAGHRDEVCSVAYSPDGKLLLSGEILGEMRLWDAASGEVRKVFSTLYKRIHLFHVEWSPSGQCFAVGCTKPVVFLFDSKTGAELGKLEGHESYVPSVRYSADGKTLASAGFDNAVRLWEVRGDLANPPLSSKELWNFDIENGPDDLAFLPDGRTMAVAHRDGHCSLWDLSKRDLITTFEAHKGGTRAVAVAPDGKSLATGGMDKSLGIWDISALTKKKR